MATMNISLPDKMKEWVESRAATGRYSNASDYVRDLIRRDKEAAEYKAWMHEQIDAGYASGFSDASIDEVFEEAMRPAGARKRRPKR